MEYKQDIYKGTDDELVGKQLNCYGYGNSAPGSGFGTLRTAILEVVHDRDRCAADCYILKANSSGQILAVGDSGGSCLLNGPDGRVLTGITWGTDEVSYADQISSTAFRGYALYHVHRERFGGIVAVADFNGDGYKDLAVGFPASSVGSRPLVGVVKIYMGSPNGLLQFRQTLTQGVLGSNETGDQFGYSLAAGDFNGDGRDDLAVGAPGEAPGSDPRSGYVFVFKGSSGGLQPWQGLDESGIGVNEVDDRFGYSLAAGDFNGDGRDDLAVAAPGEAPGDSPPSGYVFVFRGTNSELQPWQGLEPESGGLGSNEAIRLFGWALTAGDFDGDGYKDLAIGAPQEMAGRRAGVVFVYRGTLAAGLLPLHTVNQGGIGSNELGDWFGASLAAGDLDGDGRDDLAVGTPAESPFDFPESGYVFVFKGASNTTILQPWFGLGPQDWDFKAKGDWFGGTLAIVEPGSMPGGGAGLFIGAPGEVLPHSLNPGAVFTIRLERSGSGLRASLSQLITPEQHVFFPLISVTRRP
jgi:hypothetical protein